MTEALIREAPMNAMKNRNRINGRCGCFKCLALFKDEEIKEWTDQNQTALCPKCGTDTVLCDEGSIGILETIMKHWFSKEER